MANVTVEVSSDFKRILVKSDTVTMNTDYPVMLISINGTLTYSLVVGGSVTVGGTTYTTTTGADNLNFQSTLTILGTEYIHELNSITLSTATTNSVLKDGVWKIELLKADGTSSITVGALIYYDILCCLAKKMDSLFSQNSKCTAAKVMPVVREIYAMLESTKASIDVGEIINADSKYKIVSVRCADDCGCGCK